MLWRKLFRDLWLNKTAYIACLTVIIIGLMMYVSMAICYDNLETAKNRFYEEQNFADGFVKVRGMPITQVTQLERIEGIEQVQGRIVKDVRVYAPDRDENVYLRLVSVDPNKEVAINQVRIVDGVPIQGKERNILVDPAFFEANELQLGSVVSVIAEGRKVDLSIAGTAQNPEFVYAMRTAQDLYPSPETFGIAYLPFDVLSNMFSSGANVNDIVFTVREGFTYLDVEEQLRPTLRRYGLEYIIPRDKQVSNVILQQELEQLEATVATIPIVFLGIAAMVVYIMLRRMVEQQRGQIGTLKSFGYTSREILFHYLAYGVVLGIAGGLLGGLAGIALAYPLTILYQSFFALPGLESEFSIRYLFFGILLSLGFSVIAAYQGSKGLLKLQPAEAMRPPAPPVAKRIFIEKIKPLWAILSIQGKMATRNLFRNKLRAFFILIGVSFSFAMIAVSGYFSSVGDLIIGEQFEKVQTYDAKVVFSSPLEKSQVENELWGAQGVKNLETILEAPVSLEKEWRSKDILLMGLPDGGVLYNVIDDKGNKVELYNNGIYLSEHLAKDLQVGVGASLELDSPFLKGEPLTIYVAGVISQNIGSTAYMRYEYLTELLGQGKIVTSALLNIDQEHIRLLKERYQEATMVASIEDKEQTMSQITELLETFSYTTWILVLFAAACGFAIIYSTSIISLSERQRELASLRVLGMSSKEVFEVLSFEQWTISLFAMLAGIPLAYGMVTGIAQSIDTDIMVIPVVFEPHTFMLAAAGTVASILIAQLSVYRRVTKLSLVDVLKERD
ncbi:ABC transporter permease [Desulfuribacillus alkaliarsenatis]|uniref:ABC transporter permease n=1 Tax=Desulfuribacillus alkaliarsenatis TaxID=766136 RepID=UPI0009FBF83A|nr:ABC transporter permease [Desulfuribacillus alkaliarsenatis]